MSKFTTTHEINCTPDKFWATYFDKSVIRDLYLGPLGCSEATVMEQRDTDREIIQKLWVQPKMNMPAPVAKLLGPNYKYTEDGRFDKASKVFTWKRIPSTLSDKLMFEGSVRVDSISENKIRLINEVFIEAKIFGVGGLMESTFEKQIREENDTKAAYFNRIVAA